MKPIPSDKRLGALGQMDPAALEAVANADRATREPSSKMALEALDVNLLVNDEDKFLKAAMVLCNELNGRFKTSQVGLGWVRGGHVVLRTLSNTQRFQKKTDVVQRLQWAMEECADQNEEIVFPKPPDDNYIYREHEKYLNFSGMDAGVSLPLRVDGEPVGVVTLERADLPFSSGEVKALRLLCDLASRRIHELEQKSQWFGRRMLRATKKALGYVFGFEHTWTKLAVVVAACAIAALFLWPWFYRAEGNITLKTDTLLHIPAPFDGFIDQVHVSNGDIVDEGEVLLSLDRRELLLQESESLAKIKRFQTEARTNTSMGRFNDGNLARISLQEEEVRLAMIRHRLALSDTRAPFSGVIVEGDLKEKIGAPVSKGDPLFKIARLDDMHLRIEVDERDIHEIEVGAEGEFAFSSRPDIKYTFTVDKIEPSAVPKQEGNVFVLKASLNQPPDDWWRPGMNGVAKIDVGERTIFWVLTHRLVDFLRMKLWI